MRLAVITVLLVQAYLPTIVGKSGHPLPSLSLSQVWNVLSFGMVRVNWNTPVDKGNKRMGIAVIIRGDGP
jgi:hypothetical protein